MRGSASAAVARLQLLELLDALLVRDGEQHDVAAFLGAADGEHFTRGEAAASARHTHRRGRIHELAGRAGNPMQEGARRGH